MTTTKTLADVKVGDEVAVTRRITGNPHTSIARVYRRTPKRIYTSPGTFWTIDGKPAGVMAGNGSIRIVEDADRTTAEAETATRELRKAAEDSEENKLCLRIANLLTGSGVCDELAERRYALARRIGLDKLRAFAAEIEKASQ